MNYFVPISNIIALAAVFVISLNRKNERALSYASFTAGMFQVMYIFVIFLFVFKYAGSIEYTRMPASITTILIIDAVFLNVYLLLYHLLIKRMHIHYTGDMLFSDFLQLFIPPILLNTALIFIVRMDVSANAQIYSMLISTNYIILLFKSVYVICHLIIGYSISAGRNQNDNESTINS